MSEIRMFSRAERIEGGWRLAETDTHYIDVLVMLVNNRVVTAPKDDPSCYDRFWCYTGPDGGHMGALLAVELWARTGDDEPIGWVKNGQTQELRLNG